MATNQSGYKLSADAIKRIGAVVRRDEGRLPPRPGASRGDSANPWYYAKLTSTCATATFSAPTTCTVNVWQQDQASGSNPQALIVTTDQALLGLTVTNFWALGSTAAAGTQAAIEYGPGGWSFIWLDC